MRDQFIDNMITQIQQTIEILQRPSIDIREGMRQELLREVQQFLTELKIKGQ